MLNEGSSATVQPSLLRVSRPPNKRLDPTKPAAWMAEALRRVGRSWQPAAATSAGFAAHPQVVGPAEASAAWSPQRSSRRQIGARCYMNYGKLRILAELYRSQPDEHKPSIAASATVQAYLRGEPRLSAEDAQRLEQHLDVLNELSDAASRARVIDCLAHEWCNEPGFVPIPDTENVVKAFMSLRKELAARLRDKEADAFYKIYGGVPLARISR